MMGRGEKQLPILYIEIKRKLLVAALFETWCKTRVQDVFAIVIFLFALQEALRGKISHACLKINY